MNTDRNPRTGQVPLPGFAELAPAEGRAPLPGFSEAVPADPTAQTRAEGIRRVRRMSNWTAAALIVGAGATTLALAHNAVPASAPMVGSASTTGIGAAAGAHGGKGPQVANSVATTSASGVTTTTSNGVAAAAGVQGSSAPQVAHSVATTSASGVTTTTTTRVVNGKTVVTHSQSAPAYHDD